ncbi:hypothetical protein FYJ24_11330 [Actinomycetaceae bacterium WB03_NA08]|uniref:Uncharacterized protein n=2 Tax=Scrofimicrobium canadense TaxID=2652290 RepID=A0A6N7W7G5_9ACTO|nr:hypothetical protein [Scrofimicrobium canadense]
MHVMTKYLDTRKAAINALEDFALMENLAELPAEEMGEQLRADLEAPASPRLDGMPGAHDPKAGEARVCATLDKIDFLGERRRQAREYLDWFLPAWARLTDDERFVLETFFLGNGSQEEAVERISDHFYVERSSAYRRKNRALERFAKALYGA